jgi:hypothetical protein
MRDPAPRGLVPAWRRPRGRALAWPGTAWPDVRPGLAFTPPGAPLESGGMR